MNILQENPELVKTVIALLVTLIISMLSDKIIKALKLGISNKQFIVIVFVIYLILDFIVF